MLEVGLRVVRGPDWKWEDQDGGEGHAGTVVEIGKPPPSGNGVSSLNSIDKTPDKTVIVQWDHGSRSNYRIGYQNAYDLLLFDNAAAGVKHNNIICDGCQKHGIVGIRWKCAQCFDYDLCTQCYMADIHDLSHTFQRFQTANSVGVQLGTREGCTKVILKGIFIGAKVIRGPDWEWGNQDSGRGCTGRVMDIRGWDHESSRSVATVTWSSGSTNVYRLGYKGCVDLCLVEGATAGIYYKEHLPLLGKSVITIPENSNNNTAVVENSVPTISSPRHLTFNVGDKVKVLMEVDTLKEMQDGHGGWNPRMAEYIGKVGTVHRVTDRGDIRVQYEGCNNRWTFNPSVLTKLIIKDTFSLGDIVRVKNDLAAVKHYQRGHGEWIDVMKIALGKTGKVIKIYSDGDLRVALDGQYGHTWTFNPLSVTLIPTRLSKSNSVEESHKNRTANETTDSEVEKLLRDAARGDSGIVAVKEFLKKYPGRVDARAGGPGGGKKTCLQVAAHQGQRELCIILLDAGASLPAVDEDGDTPLHYAAFGNQPEIMELLLSRGAAINAVNNGRCSALHVAVNKQHAQCVKTLLRYHCDVNLQDSYGDTALHDAIGKDAVDIVDALCNCNEVDFTLRNKRGFNVLHHAALKGNEYATQKLVTRASQLVDVKKDDGFAALHLAALNGHRDVAAALLSPLEGKANVDLRNNRRQTPLHLATCQGHWPLVELLVHQKADISSTDEDGDTVLHIAIAKSHNQSITVSSSEMSRESPIIHGIWQDLVRRGARTELALACFFVNVDRSFNILEQAKNSKLKTPLDLLANTTDPETCTSLTELLLSYRYPMDNQLQSSIDLPIQTESLEPIPTTRNNAKCQECLGISTSVSGEDDQSVVGNSCVHCTRGVDGNSSKNDISIVQEEEKFQDNELTQDFKDKANIKKEKDKAMERLRYLETRVADLEEANMCSICMERHRNVAFLCGHGACEHCAAPLKTCHMCRKTITNKINLY